MVYEDAAHVQKVIAETVSEHPIVLFVKGSPEAPQCGFSKGVMDIFSFIGVPYKTVNVLADPLVREGIKQFTQWPTIPQIFIKGEFIGGFDIVRDLFEKGELEPMVKAADPR
jgi:monothiol glutaredoxin